MASSSFTFKVHISCCSVCPEKVKEKLQKVAGVDSIRMDVSKGLVTISGSVEPSVIVQKFKKWGKKAELWSFQENPVQGEDDEGNSSTCNKTIYSAKHVILDEENRYSSISYSGSDAGRSTGSIAKGSRNRKGGRLCSLAKLLVGLKPSGQPKAASARAMNPGKWQFPNTHLRQFGPTQFYGSQYPGPPLNGRSIVGPHPVYGPRPPVPPYGVMHPMPGYGFMPSVPSAPPLRNPMIHYTSYEDNYRLW